MGKRGRALRAAHVSSLVGSPMKYQKAVWSTLALIGAASIICFVGYVSIQADEVNYCKWEQWKAGGKKQAGMDIASNVSFRREGDDIIVDFRELEKVWSRICLATFYAPGSPYLTRRDATGVGIENRRTRGCWAGHDPENFTLLLTNRDTIEAEDYRLEVPSEFRDRSRGRIIDPDYRYLDPPGDEVQCTNTSDAVATCMKVRSENSDYCLPVFRR
jgi:hypothetical protein